jgi:hypothetical protein
MIRSLPGAVPGALTGLRGRAYLYSGKGESKAGRQDAPPARQDRVVVAHGDPSASRAGRRQFKRTAGARAPRCLQ